MSNPNLSWKDGNVLKINLTMCLNRELTKASKILCCTIKFSVAPDLQGVLVYQHSVLSESCLRVKNEESTVNLTLSCRLQSFYIRHTRKELLHGDALDRTEFLSLHFPSLILDLFSSFLVLFTTYTTPVMVWHTVYCISLSSQKVLQAVRFVCCIHCCDFSAWDIELSSHTCYINERMNPNWRR